MQVIKFSTMLDLTSIDYLGFVFGLKRCLCSFITWTGMYSSLITNKTPRL